VLVGTREGAVLARTAAINQLRALVIAAPEPLRASLRGLAFAELVARCTRLRPGARDASTRASALALRSTAKRIAALSVEASQLRREIAQLVAAVAPTLLTEPGVGPISAAPILIACSHQGRFRSEASFAMLAGASPIPAFSSQTIRHRLNRGGDRQLNRALHTIALARRATHRPTRDYIDRRIRERKTLARSTAASSATSHHTSTDCSSAHQRLDSYRSSKAERFIRTLLAGWAYAAIDRDSDELQRTLAGWLDYDKRRRPHRSLGRQTPLDRLQTLNRNNVLGSYT